MLGTVVAQRCQRRSFIFDLDVEFRSSTFLQIECNRLHILIEQYKVNMFV